jgi:hypothetical protein
VTDSSFRERFSAWWRHAFAVDKYDESSLSEEDKLALQSLAARISASGMTTPAILMLQSNRHMNFIGSQVMVAAEPIYGLTHQLLQPLLTRIGLYIPPAEMPALIAAFEKRYSVEYVIQQLEAAADEDGTAPAGEQQPS